MTSLCVHILFHAQIANLCSVEEEEEEEERGIGPGRNPPITKYFSESSPSLLQSFMSSFLVPGFRLCISVLLPTMISTTHRSPHHHFVLFSVFVRILYVHFHRE